MLKHCYKNYLLPAVLWNSLYSVECESHLHVLSKSIVYILKKLAFIIITKPVAILTTINIEQGESN